MGSNARAPRAAPTQRQLRIGEELRHNLALILERGDVRDPALAETSITVTEARVSSDLRHVTFFIAPFGADADVATVVAGLSRARPYLRRSLAQTVRLKFMPSLSFRPDGSFDEAEQIERLLRSPEVARDLQAGGDRDAEDQADEEPPQ